MEVVHILYFIILFFLAFRINQFIVFGIIIILHHIFQKAELIGQYCQSSSDSL